MNGTRYSPAFKFQVVLEALKAERKGAEARVARAYGMHPVTLAKRRLRSPERLKVSYRNEELKAKVLRVVGEHPVYGYCRIKVELEVGHGIKVNHKRLRRCLREWDLTLRRQVARPRSSGVRKFLKEGKGRLNLVAGWEPAPLQVLYTDFTEIKYARSQRKAH